MIELRLLGGLELMDEGGRPVSAILAQPKRVALLAYLALTPEQGFRRRDSIAALLWPDQDQEHARGSLRQAVRFLRRELGNALILNRGDEEIALDSAHVSCDVVRFERAVAADDPDEAVRLYRGALLEGFYIADAASEFDQWLDRQRARMRELAARVLWTSVQRHRERGAFSDAIAAARDAVRLSPDDEASMRRLLELLDDAGDRAGAISAYEEFAASLRVEHESEPSAETQRSISEIKARTAPRGRLSPHVFPAQPLLSDHASRASSVSRRSRQFSWIGVAAAILLIGGYFAISAFRAVKRGSHLLTVAVLPVRDLSGDTTQRILPEALTDELITDLAQIAAFRVINRGTMMRFADSTTSAESIAQRVGADAVVTTNLQRSGDSLRLRTQIVMAGDPRVAWARSFSGTSARAFEWQKDVALAATDWARIKLQTIERTGLSARRDIDPVAFELYSKGRWWWNKRGREGLSRADSFFHQALDVEPTYSLAWSGLADTYAQLGYGGYLPPNEAFLKAKAMARRALELDSTLAEPHAALGYSMMYFDWDWRGAEREFKLAISRRPSYATAHEWYGLFLAAMGRFPEAERQGRLAQELDPLSASVAGTRGWILHYAGKDDEALRVLRAGARTDSRNGIVQLYLGRVHQSMGRYDSATAHYDSTGKLRVWIPSIAGRGVVASLMGHPDAARATIAQLDSLARAGEYVTPYAVALVYTALGERDSAFALLERGFTERTHWMVWLNRDTRWKSLHGDPRFESLIHRIGLPQ